MPDKDNPNELVLNILIAVFSELPNELRLEAMNTLKEYFCEHCGADGESPCIHTRLGWNNDE